MLVAVLSPVTGILLGLLLGGSAETHCPAVVDSSVIETVKMLPAQRLEEALADEPLDKWFQELVGKGVEVCWETNDCSEQTSDPAIDHERDIPMCVEVWVPDSSAGRVSFALVVGSYRQGVHGVPRLRHVYVQNGEGVQRLESLGELLQLIRENRPGQSR